MIDKKTLVIAIVISWILTLATAILADNIAPTLTQVFSPQVSESNNVKVVKLQKQGIINPDIIQPEGNIYYVNLSWVPSNKNNNAILEIQLSVEYTIDAETLNNLRLVYVLRIQELKFESGTRMDIENTTDEWKLTSFKIPSTTDGSWIIPNQNEYLFRLMFLPEYNQGLIRNVNLTLLVIDG